MAKTLRTPSGELRYHPLTDAVDSDTASRLPYVVRIFIENVLRHGGDPSSLAGWPGAERSEFAYYPGRVLLQDLTGVPVVADLAAIQAAVTRSGGNPGNVNPRIPADLVIDHSVFVDFFGSANALERNVDIEYQRNQERYALLRWAQQAFDNFRVVPPGAGICHQVNLELLSSVVAVRDGVAFPDTLLGTDSHTPMVGGVGVMAWGVGGIEAEAAMLGEPIALLTPQVVGVRIEGQLRDGVTATDLVLTITELLRAHGVVGKFVEFFGPGLSSLTVPDRATISNMSPEYGATEGFFPVDDQTLAYLRATGRSDDHVALVESYCRTQFLFRDDDSAEPDYQELVGLDLSSVVPSLAGPRRPQDRVRLSDLPETFKTALKTLRPGDGTSKRTVSTGHGDVGDGSVVIAAITSCTNTSNPSVMLGAGLLARNAVQRGLKVSPAVKTSLAPGSPVVIDYLRRAELLGDLEKLGFYLVGFGCTTCIGNSGPLPDQIHEAIENNNLSVSAVLSGNRNFEGRIHPDVDLSFLASPPLVVAYALAGTTDIDLTAQPLGTDHDGEDVYLRDIWPSSAEVAEAVARSLDPEQFRTRFSTIFEGDERWKALPVPSGAVFTFDPDSTYVAEPPFVRDVAPCPAPLEDITQGRVLVYAGDSVTTDHISPAGVIPVDSDAARWLAERGVAPQNLHTYGARRGHHEVMVRGTFANRKLANKLVPGVLGSATLHLPDGKQMTIFQASERYRAEGVPLIVLAGAEYGSGSSRDWAAKGTALLGVRAVIAQSFERIHRSNLVQMGVLPLEFLEGESAQTHGLDGHESYHISLVGLRPRAVLTVRAARPDGTEISFKVLARVDTPTDMRFLTQGGILPAVTREMLRS